MIPRREPDELCGEWSLEIGVIEKDYVLGWLLAGIAQHPELEPTWIFKGGTCLRKCLQVRQDRPATSALWAPSPRCLPAGRIR